MTPGRYDFLIYQGTTFTRTIQVEQPNGDPYPFGGFTPIMQIRPNYESDVTYPVTCSIVSGDIVASLTPLQTDAIPGGRYVYDLEIHGPGDTVHRVLNGIVTVSRQVTR
jgi:hypothetical protein